jgi:hypothetical protein
MGFSAWVTLTNGGVINAFAMNRMVTLATELQVASDATDWVPLVPASGYSSIASTPSRARLELQGSGSGVIRLDGSVAINTGTIANGATIMTLPTVYRPARQQALIVAGGTTTFMKIVIGITGTIVVTLINGTPTAVSLQGISYSQF